MIQATNLSKHYGKTQALNQLNLAIPAGACYGLLGPNGAGKSTFIKLLLGFVFPSDGAIHLSSVAKTEIGYLPERVALPMAATVDEYLTLVGQLCNLRTHRLRSMVDQRLQQVGMTHARDRRIGTCSKGMLQRVVLAASLLGDPALLVLDEPMSGLDPEAQHHIRQLIRQTHQAGTTLLLCTHDLADVAELCTHIAIVNRGQLVRAGALSEVLPWRNQVTIQVQSWRPGQAATLHSIYPGLQIQAEILHLGEQLIAHKAEILSMLLEMKVDIVGLHQQRASLEEVYLEAINR